MALMYDSVTATNIPSDATLMAGYINGDYPSYSKMVTLFPNAHVVSITVTSSGNGDVLDVENGDATAQDAPAWVLRQRANGTDPTVYTSLDDNDSSYGWPIVQQAFADQAVSPPHYWIAQYPTVTPTNPVIAASWVSLGAVAWQYADVGPFDLSVTNGTWPFSPPSPSRPTTYSRSLLLLGG